MWNTLSNLIFVTSSNVQLPTCFEICTVLIDWQLSVPRKASGGGSRRVRGSFHLSVFWWQRRIYSHARTCRVAFYNNNIRVPSEGRLNSRRAYTFNCSGGASFATATTRNVIIFTECVYIYMYLSFINIGWVRRRCGLLIPLL